MFLRIALRTVGVDASEPLARNAACDALPTARADALRLPFADESVDIVLCSQLLHHFEDELAVALLRELDRVARHRVIVSDLRRSWLAASGIWLVSFPLRFHPVSRHDGVVSVLRGFTRPTLYSIVYWFQYLSLLRGIGTRLPVGQMMSEPAVSSE